MDRVRSAVMDHAMRLMSERPDEPISYINLYLPCTFFMLRSIRCSGMSCMYEQHRPSLA